jgi:hypothetical protein
MGIINQSYQKDTGRLIGPVYFPGEVYSFYLNMDAPTSDPDFANFRLDLMAADGITLVQPDIGPLSQHLRGSGFYNIYSVFLCPAVVFGWYRFRIYDHVASLQKALSSPILIEEEAVVKNTAIISYRNSEDRNGIGYETLPDFWNRVRLPLIQLGATRPVTDRKQYRNASNQRLRNWKSVKDKIATIEAYYVDEELHNAIDEIFDHDNVFLNYTFVVAKEAYALQERIDSKLSKATIDVAIDETVKLPDSLINLVSVFDPIDFTDEFE